MSFLTRRQLRGMTGPTSRRKGLSLHVLAALEVLLSPYSVNRERNSQTVSSRERFRHVCRCCSMLVSAAPAEVVHFASSAEGMHMHAVSISEL